LINLKLRDGTRDNFFFEKFSINFKTKNLAFRVEKFHSFSFKAMKKQIQNRSKFAENRRLDFGENDRKLKLERIKRNLKTEALIG